MSLAFRAPSKLFTIDEANRTLPLVRKIVGDIRQTYVRLVERYGVYRAQSEGTPTGDVDLDRLHADLEDEKHLLGTYIKELADLGILLKGPAEGIIDFPALRDGKVVMLCWKLDEPTVGHWHEMDAGFASRKPLDPSAWAAEAEAEAVAP